MLFLLILKLLTKILSHSGQWLRGMRHGYGVRTSAAYGHSTITKMASSNANKNATSMESLVTEEEDPDMPQASHRDAVRGGFVLVARANTQSHNKRRNSLMEKTTSSSSLTGGFFKGLRLRKQRSTGDLDLRSQRNQKSMTPSLRSYRETSETGSNGSMHGAMDANAEQQEVGSNASFLTQNGDISDPNTVETYYGEWKNDKRCGFGICERTDGLRYEGEWYNNKKYGYGVTTFPDGTREEGKYKNNLLVTNVRKKHLFMMRGSKLRERIEAACVASARGQEIALQKSDIAASRTATARAKSEQADYAASTAQNDSQMAIIIAKQHGGADLATHAQGSIAPLRRRLSGFNQIRKMRDTADMPPNTFDDGGGGGGGPPMSSRQFLEPSEPFGGRRGSFRTEQMNQQVNNNMNYHNPNLGNGPMSYDHPMHQQAPNMGYGHFPGNPMHPAHRFGLPPPPNAQQQHNNKDPFTQAFSDHFDHYQKNMRVQRGGTPQSLASNRYNQSNSYNNSLMGSSTYLSNNKNMSPSPTPMPSEYSLATNDNSSPTFNSRPSTSMSSNIGNNIQQQQQSSPIMPSAFSPNSQRFKAQQIAREYGMSGTANNNNNNIDDQNSGVRHLRTASLYRPGAVQLPVPSSGSGGGGGLKRKPSLQVNPAKVINKPIMSREEASYLSHQQREQRRQEQEYHDRRARNPFLYVWNPNFINWLNRQKLVIVVFLINITIAYLFISMIM